MKRFVPVMLSLLLLALVAGTGCEYIFNVSPTPTETVPSTPSPINPSFTPLPTSGSTATPNSSPSPGATLPAYPDYADLVAKVKPSVVAISTELTGFLGVTKGAGSGWVIHPDGLILTNYHVIEGATRVTVSFDNGNFYDARTIRGDAISDLAVIDIGVSNLPAANIGDSAAVRVGNPVLAIGNALGEGISATFGIISLTSVSIQVSESETLYNMLATSAQINPGSSGGPLVNMAGEVVGITSVKLASVEVEGRGYAIPTNTAIPIANELIEKGYITRPWLGVTLDDVTQFDVLRYGLGTSTGALIEEVYSQSPAAAAGLQRIDVIISFGGKEIKGAYDLVTAIRASQIGQTVEISYYRGKDRLTTNATLRESPPP